MKLFSLGESVRHLLKAGQLKIIDYPVDPHLEMGLIQRRAFQAKAPALLFSKPKNSLFPMLANLYGTRERLDCIFGKNIETIKKIFQLKASPSEILRKPAKILPILPTLRHALPHRKKYSSAGKNKIPCLEYVTTLSQLPKLVSWPEDGGAFITLPIVQSHDPVLHTQNLGMYRIQLDGNEYNDNEVGLHYQLKRGIGVHHARALNLGQKLPVHVYVGGPPALAIAAVMPLPEGMDELMFASLLSGFGIETALLKGFDLPVIAQADFLLQGTLSDTVKPEGPFGDHLGYYSLTHPFPVLKVKKVYHRKNAIWPFTTVGRPPQEDTVFGDFIHELTAPLVKSVFPGISSINAVDAAGVHPLLLAVGSERYTPYDKQIIPKELLTQAFHLLGNTQTALAKYLLICCQDSHFPVNAKDVPGFFSFFLERTDLRHDLHFITETTSDTLDYSGGSLHEGSKLIWAAAGDKKRDLGIELVDMPLPDGFTWPKLANPGIIVLQSLPHFLDKGHPDPLISQKLAPMLACWPHRELYPLLIITDDSDFTARTLQNFLWVTFTRSDPALDIYGADAKFSGKHWQCNTPLIIDARKKKYMPPVLEDDPAVVRRVEKLAARNGPLQGIF